MARLAPGRPSPAFWSMSCNMTRKDCSPVQHGKTGELTLPTQEEISKWAKGTLRSLNLARSASQY